MAHEPTSPTNDSPIYDITIIGGGPVGIFGLYNAGMRAAKTKMIESLGQLGGQLMALYPEKYIYDVAGFPKVLAKDLIGQLKEQALPFNPAVCLEETVQTLERQPEGHFRLTTTKGEHLTKTVIVTAGLGAFAPKKPDLPGIEKYEGRGLHYSISDLESFRGKRVMVVGGGDSAVDWALMLEGVGAQVTLIHRRPEFRAHEESVRQLHESKVNVVTPYELKELHGDDRLTGVTIFNNRTKEEQTCELDALVICIGFMSKLGPIKDWGLELEDDQIVVNSRMETNIPGIYAAGDIVTYPGKIKLIAVGFGEVATAVNNAKKFVDPSASLFPGHSSTRGK